MQSVAPAAPAPVAPADPDFPAARPLSEQIAEAIVSMIAAGTLAPGQRLVESDIAERFHTSRVPVREAVKILEAQGILATTPYRGTHVGEFGPREQAQLTEVRVALEKLIVRQAAALVRAHPQALASLDRALSRMAECVLTGNRIGLNRADVEFHRAMTLLTGNAILITLWGAIAHHVLIGFGLSNERYPDSAAVLAQHQKLRATLLSAPPETLESAIEAHVLGRDIPAGAAPGPRPNQTPAVRKRREA
jgi:DNA-binding GntR family transcriptional regulator